MSTVRHRLPDQVLDPDLVLAGRPGQPVTRPPEGDIDEVLLVGHHQELAETVADVLRGEGIAADVARDGQAALDRSTVNGYDVLDRDLPGVHGDKVCRALAPEGARAGCSCSPPLVAPRTGATGSRRCSAIRPRD